MRKVLRSIVLLFILATAAGTLEAGEHAFGLRAGSFQFPDSGVTTQYYDLFRAGMEIPDNFAGFVVQTDFDGSDLDRTLWEFYYEFRRDTDSHFAFSVQAGVGSADSTNNVSGYAVVPNDPFDYNRNGNFGQILRGVPELVPANMDTLLEHTIYFVQVVPKYYFTTGKARFFMGAGLGLWANLWREVLEGSWVDILTCNPAPPQTATCSGTASYRESAGNRRTIVPFSVNAGLTWQFRPHWSFFLEDQFLFNGDSSVILYRQEATYTITGNQIFVGFAYQL